MEVYKQFMDFLINFINELIDLFNDNKISPKEKFIKLSYIILNEKNRIYIGIVFIILSFTFYLVDNTT
tara:strand:+ start:663 stop:866 length:204 start_codon:yes stop_codon:yes gene_type:complete